MKKRTFTMDLRNIYSKYNQHNPRMKCFNKIFLKEWDFTFITLVTISKN